MLSFALKAAIFFALALPTAVFGQCPANLITASAPSPAYLNLDQVAAKEWEASYTDNLVFVKLNAAPGATPVRVNVTVTTTSPRTTKPLFNVTPRTLVFSAANWTTPQTVEYTLKYGNETKMNVQSTYTNRFTVTAVSGSGSCWTSAAKSVNVTATLRTEISGTGCRFNIACFWGWY